MDGERVVVRIKTFQFREDDEDIIDKKYYGIVTEKNNSTYINISEDKNMNGKTDIIKITEDEVIILRRNEAVSNMRFKEGKIHRTEYKTDYNIFELVINTKSLEKKVKEDRIEINIDYMISVQGFMEAENKVYIDIKR